MIGLRSAEFGIDSPYTRAIQSDNFTLLKIGVTAPQNHVLNFFIEFTVVDIRLRPDDIQVINTVTGKFG